MKTCLLLTALMLGAFTAAHSSLESSTPAADSTVQERPTEVSLTFGEAVEPRFSTFLVYPLGLGGGDPEALEEKADALLSRVLSTPDTKQIKTQLLTQAANATVTLALPEDLKPGSYAVMWRALSVDTHTVQDLLVFTYQP